MKSNVYLYGLKQFALIVPMASGVVYHQQTAGIMCNQQSLEGALYPLEEDFSGLHYDSEQLTQADADACDKIFADAQITTLLAIDRARLTESEEAWIWVLVDELSMYSVEPFKRPFSAVLTWENSD